MNNPSDPSFLLREEKEFTRRYRLTLWWVKHRLLAKRVGYVALIGGNALMFLFVLWTFMDAFAVSYDADRNRVASMVRDGFSDLRAYTASRAGSLLEAEPVRVLSTGSNRYDFITFLENPNDDWSARFQYRFISTAGETQGQEGFILPGEKKPIMILGFEGSDAARDVTFALGEIEWRRVDKKHIPDYASFADARLRFTVRDIDYSTDVALDATRLGRVSFTVTNESAYGYYDPAFYAILKRADAVVGVNRVILETLGSGETREVVMHWFGPLPSVSKVEIVPEVNILEPIVYQPL